MFYNWYDPTTGAKLTTWPNDGSTVKPFLSSVDNGWLATGLLVAARAEPSLRREGGPDPRGDGLRLLLQPGRETAAARSAAASGTTTRNDPAAVTGDYCGMGTDVWYTGHHYGAFNTEPRMASYLGIAAGQIPQKHYFGTFRTFPPTLRLVVDRDHADRHLADLRGRRRLRGRAALPRHATWCRPGAGACSRR